MSRVFHVTALILSMLLGCDAASTGPTGSVRRAAWGSPSPSYLFAAPGALAPGATAASGADVSIFAFGPDVAAVGEVVEYGSGGYNLGPDLATKVAVMVTVSGPFDGVKWSAWPDCAEVPAPPGLFALQCTLAQMATTDKLPPINLSVRTSGPGKLVYAVDISAAEPDPNPDNNRASVSTAVGSAPTGADLALYAYGPAELMVGEMGTAYFWAENGGPSLASKVALDLVATGPVELVPAPPCVLTSPSTATCALGDLPRYGGVELYAGLRPLAEGVITLEGALLSATEDPQPGNNRAGVKLLAYVPVVADLAVAITDEPDPAQWKRPVTWTTAVSNRGPDPSGGAYLWQSVPEGLNLDQVTPSQGYCFSDPWGVYCELGKLPAGGAATVSVKGTPQLGGTLVVKAEVYGQKRGQDPDWSNNYASAETSVRGGFPAITSTENLRVPTTIGAFIPCSGDFVILEGELHVLTHTTISRDQYQLVYAVQPQGLRGIGLASGAVYNGTGGTREMVRRSRSDLGGEFTYVNNYRMVSRGPYPNLTVHQLLHLTVHPDGSVTGSVDHERVECR